MKFYKIGFFAIKVAIKIPLSEKILAPHSFPSSTIHSEITSCIQLENTRCV